MKALVLFVAAMMLLALVAGCGGGGDTTPLPRVTITASALNVEAGTSVTLSWLSTDANGVQASNFGATQFNGSLSVTPTATTTYTITVKGEGGVSQPASVTVVVNSPVINNPANLVGGMWHLNSVTVNGAAVPTREYAQWSSNSSAATNEFMEFVSGNVKMYCDENDDGIIIEFASAPYTANASVISVNGSSTPYSVTAHSLTITWTGDYKNLTNVPIIEKYAKMVNN